jgi:hypothetical protein
MGRLGGCADLNLGTPPLLPWLNPLGERRSPSLGPEPERRSVKEVMKLGGVKVKAAWSRLPAEDAMAIVWTGGDWERGCDVNGGLEWLLARWRLK